MEINVESYELYEIAENLLALIKKAISELEKVGNNAD